MIICMVQGVSEDNVTRTYKVKPFVGIEKNIEDAIAMAHEYNENVKFYVNGVDVYIVSQTDKVEAVMNYLTRLRAEIRNEAEKKSDNNSIQHTDQTDNEIQLLKKISPNDRECLYKWIISAIMSRNVTFHHHHLEMLINIFKNSSPEAFNEGKDIEKEIESLSKNKDISSKYQLVVTNFVSALTFFKEKESENISFRPTLNLDKALFNS